MTILQILILAIIQGAAELLPVSSSAHVIVAEKLMKLDPTRPELTLLLVMLHTGTMLAVICYFWRSWKATFFASGAVFRAFLKRLAIATALTGVVGLVLKVLIEKVLLKGEAKAEVEQLFGNLNLISGALAVVGILILLSGFRTMRPSRKEAELDLAGSCWMGLVQGLCLPFRGFSRSGATISVGLMRGLSRKQVEEFSFALAVVLTPIVLGLEVHRLLQARHCAAACGTPLLALFRPSLVGMVLSFLSGLLALRWLSAWLEKGRWYLFGIYCISASMIVFVLSWSGI